MATKAKVCKKDTEGKGNITFSFANGKTFQVDCTAFDEDLQEQAMMHGFSQKLGDSYSGAQSVDEAVEAFQATLSGLENGTWNSGRAATGGLWVDAIALEQGIDREDALERWNGLDDDTRTRVKKIPRIKAAYTKLLAARAEAAAASSDTDDLDDLLG